MIGNLGTVLGENKINIATFALGRSAPGQDAIALIEIDGTIPPDVLDKVRRLPNVRQAKALVF
jgi:D-3-phosphoglycerate dehydrogenase